MQAVSEFLQALQRSDVHLQAVYLYGSHAAGNAHSDSDIDVALVSEDFGDWPADHERVVGALLACDTRIEPVRFRPEEFCDENPLAWEIKTKGIRLLRPTASTGWTRATWRMGALQCARPPRR